MLATVTEVDVLVVAPPVKTVGAGIVAIVAPAGMPVPVITWPTTRPVVLATVTEVDVLVVAPPVKTVGAGIVAIVAPAGMPVPVMAWPTTRPVVLATVTEVDVLVVAPPVSVTGAAKFAMVVPAGMPATVLKTGCPTYILATCTAVTPWRTEVVRVVIPVVLTTPALPKVRKFVPVAVTAAVDNVTCVAESTVEIVVLAGMPLPVTLCPANNPVVLIMVTVLAAAVSTPGRAWVLVPSVNVAAVPESTRRVSAEAPLLTMRALTVAAALVR